MPIEGEELRIGDKLGFEGWGRRRGVAGVGRALPPVRQAGAEPRLRAETAVRPVPGLGEARLQCGLVSSQVGQRYPGGTGLVAKLGSQDQQSGRGSERKEQDEGSRPHGC